MTEGFTCETCKKDFEEIESNGMTPDALWAVCPHCGGWGKSIFYGYMREGEK